MGLKEELLSRSDRKEYNPKTKTGWKKVKGKWTYFENGKEKGTGLGDALWNLPGQIRDYNRKANDQDRSTEPWQIRKKPQKVKPEEQYTTGVGPGIKRFGPKAEADKADFYQSLSEDIESQKQDTESRNYSLWLQNKIVNSETEREKARWLTQYWSLMGFDQADIIKKERGEGENWIIPERTWQNPEGQVSDQPSTGDLSMFEEDPENVLDTKVNENQAQPITPNENPKPISQKYTRPTASERQERRMEDTLVRGRPLEKFKLDRKRGRGTDVDDLFTKNRGTNGISSSR